MQEEINTLKSELNKTKTLLETQVTEKIPRTPDTSETIVELESYVRLLVTTNDELNQELEKTKISNTRLHQIMWEHQLESAPTFSLYHAYELQSDICLSILTFHRGQEISEEQWDDAWELAEKFDNMQNLICEMLVQGDLVLTNWNALFYPIVDLGARALLYYINLEKELSHCRKVDLTTSCSRCVHIIDHKSQMDPALMAQGEVRENWKQELFRIRDLVKNCGDIISSAHSLLAAITNREAVAQRGELAGSHYVYNMHETYKRLCKTLDAFSRGDVLLYPMKEMVVFDLLPPHYKPASWMTTKTPIQGSPLTYQFLGQYYHMYKDIAKERPIPSWKALEWLAEDYGLSETEDEPYNRLYQKISADWQKDPPVSVVTNTHFCLCERRYKWDPYATIDSIEYNWPQIPGAFTSPESCAEAYGDFHEKHITHTDPVCFRAAVFCDFLRMVCADHKVIINVNKFDHLRPEFHIHTKFQYKSTRWQRVLEVMSITHF